jgi:hypothetical protein
MFDPCAFHNFNYQIFGYGQVSPENLLLSRERLIAL